MSRVRCITLGLVCGIACLLPATALASRTMDSTLMDDNQLIYQTSPLAIVQNLQRIAALGVDRVKVSMVWLLVAPSAYSPQRPNFDATNPTAYGAAAWARYDLIVAEAHSLGLKVYFQLTPPAPAWGIPAGQPQQGEARGRAPNPPDFQQFVEAVGRRYSGSFVPPGQTRPLPRVDYWGLWNEPNVTGWLNPWHNGSLLLQPPLYRAVVNAAWSGLQASGHTPATDTILVGETANSGVGSVTQFVYNLYCLSPKLKPLSGNAAARAGCPTSPSKAKFVAANPGLFGATGFAHHPYGFNAPPDRRYPLKSWITMFNLGSIESQLNRVFASYGKRRRGGVPLYLTEYGYESNPPNPFVRNSTGQQATWINQAEYMAYNYSYVRSFNQFELADSPPNAAEKPGSYAYWTTSFQMGLLFSNFKPKPAYAAFRIPIWVPRQVHGRGVVVWGQLRPADHRGRQSATIQFARAGSRSFRRLATVVTRNREGFFLTRVGIPGAGLLRIAWRSPNAGVYYSRTVRIS
jgi:hypothetical protein